MTVTITESGFDGFPSGVIHTFDDLIQGTDEWLQARCGIPTHQSSGSSSPKDPPTH